VQRIHQRTQPCSPEVAALPYHYQADFIRGPLRLSLELSTAEAYPEPEPALFLLQACLSSLIVRVCPDLEAWRALMGVGALDRDAAMYQLARQHAHALAALFSPDQLEILEQITIDQLGSSDDAGEPDT
jgi:hypothetical protein